MQHAAWFTRHSSLVTPRSVLPWLALALLTGLFYLAVSTWAYGFSGFPLDDAWIHQTYARNLARSGQLAFVPGVPSAGSTAPFWTFLLSVGYLLHIPFKLWTYSLGILFLGLTGWTVAKLGQQLFPQKPSIGLWAGLFCIFEWHLVWAAVSGMETILFIWLSLFLFECYLAGQQYDEIKLRRDIGLGLLGGLLVLTRPEGIGLIGLIGLDMTLRIRWQVAGGKLQVKNLPLVTFLLRRWLAIAIGLGALLAPYIAFHLYLTGLPFPSTLYAKQTEYGIILQTFPLWWRLFGNIGLSLETVQGVFRVIFIGAQFLLLPGLFFGVWLTIKKRRLSLLPVWLWWIGYLLLYGLQLPVTYQHGRYQIPAIPWMILLGVWGTMHLVQWLSTRHLLLRVVSRAGVISLAILVPVFTLVGAQAYGRDVRFIESEMVATAKWLDAQTSPQALIAAHDIGALGYFAQRPLIDLAGLVTPEVIPIIRDEPALFEFVVTHQADYLVTFPSWYPEMTRQPGLRLQYTTNAPWAPQLAGENMAVYQITTFSDP